MWKKSKKNSPGAGQPLVRIKGNVAISPTGLALAAVMEIDGEIHLQPLREGKRYGIITDHMKVTDKQSAIDLLTIAMKRVIKESKKDLN